MHQKKSVEMFLQAGVGDQGQSGEIQLGKPTFLWVKAWRALKLPAMHMIDPFSIHGLQGSWRSVVSQSEFLESSSLRR